MEFELNLSRAKEAEPEPSARVTAQEVDPIGAWAAAALDVDRPFVERIGEALSDRWSES